eukprot:7620506-Karenia_brevis.AAC.1
MEAKSIRIDWGAGCVKIKGKKEPIASVSNEAEVDINTDIEDTKPMVEQSLKDWMAKRGFDLEE